MYNEDKEKWYIVYTKKPEQKAKWMKAFRDERARVKEDANSGEFMPFRLSFTAFVGVGRNPGGEGAIGRRECVVPKGGVLEMLQSEIGHLFG